MKQTAAPWTLVELINGWKPIPGFQPPMYRRVGKALDFKGHAEPADDAFPMCQLPEKFRDLFGSDSYTVTMGEKVLRSSIDHEGYVYMQVTP